MLRPRFCWLVLLLTGLFCLSDMRGDDAPKLAKVEPSTKVPARLLKAIASKAAKTPAIAPEREPATGEKEPAEKVEAKESKAAEAKAADKPEVKAAKLTP